MPPPRGVAVTSSCGHLRHYAGVLGPLVLVGELLSGGAAWARHADRLAPRYQVVTVTPLVVRDAVAGRAMDPAWSIPGECAALARALRLEGVGPAHFGGWSMGGAVALHMALAFPEQVRSLTLVEPQVRWLLRARGLLTKEERRDADIYRGMVGSPPTEESVARFLWMVGAVAEEQDPRESRAWRLAWANRFAIPASARVVDHEESIERVKALRVPVLLVQGRETGILDQAMGEALASLWPQATRMLLRGGHASHLTDGDAFLEGFEAFIQAGA